MINSLWCLSLLVLLQAAPAPTPVVQPSPAPPKPRILFDLAHGQTYFNAVAGKETTLQKSYAAIFDSLGIEAGFSAQRLTAQVLEGYQAVVIVVPLQPVDPSEEQAVVDFVNRGGSLLLVFDEERRVSLEKSRVNEIIRPFGLTLTADTPILHNRGALARAGRINQVDREVPYSGGRAVEGGTPFSLILEADGRPSSLAHAAWVETAARGRVIVMGDAMAAILLGVPEGVRLGGGLRPFDTAWWGRDSRMFMTEVLSWLTHRIR